MYSEGHMYNGKFVSSHMIGMPLIMELTCILWDTCTMVSLSISQDGHVTDHEAYMYSERHMYNGKFVSSDRMGMSLIIGHI